MSELQVTTEQLYTIIGRLYVGNAQLSGLLANSNVRLAKLETRIAGLEEIIAKKSEPEEKEID